MNLWTSGNNLTSLARKTQLIVTPKGLWSGVRPAGRSYGKTIFLRPTQFTNPMQEAPLEF
jgi:hypothetical protein